MYNVFSSKNNRDFVFRKGSRLILYLLVLMLSDQAFAGITITPVSTGIVFALDSTGVRKISLPELATVSGASASASTIFSPSAFDCSSLGGQTITVKVRDGADSASLQIRVTVTSPLKIIYPLPGVFVIPAYGGCVGIMPDFSKVIRVSKNCGSKVSFSQSELPDFAVSTYTTDTTFVTLTARDELGNSDSVRVKVIAKSDPGGKTRINSSDTVICAGSAVTFTSDLEDVLFGQWQINQVLVPGAYYKTFSTSSLKDGDRVNYSVKTACAGFFLSNTIRIRVLPTTLPVVSLKTGRVGCTGDTLTCTASISYSLTNKLYNWKLNGLAVADPDSVYQASSLKPGDFLSCSVTGNTPCLGRVSSAEAHDTISQLFFVKSSITILPSDTVVCAGFAVSFTAKAINARPGASYNWRVNEQLVGVHGPTFVLKIPSDGDRVDCILTDSGTCAGPVFSEPVTVRVNPLPVITGLKTVTITAGSGIRLVPAVTGRISSYSWSPSAGLNDPSSASPIASPSKSTTYTLFIVSSGGCTASAEVRVEVVSPLLIIPNMFTPNGDGINDTWRIAGIEAYPECSVEIYNRYGRLVYRSLGYGKAWDGTIAGEPLAVSAYYYLIKTSPGARPLAGEVTVIR